MKCTVVECARQSLFYIFKQIYTTHLNGDYYCAYKKNVAALKARLQFDIDGLKQTLAVCSTGFFETKLVSKIYAYIQTDLTTSTLLLIQMGSELPASACHQVKILFCPV